MSNVHRTVRFSHDGQSLADRFEYRDNDAVKEKSRLILDAFDEAVKELLDPVKYPFDFSDPPKPEEREAFEEYVLNVLLVPALGKVAEALAGLLGGDDYYFQRGPASSCRPCGDDCHIGMGSLFNGCTLEDFVHSIVSNNATFNYRLVCEIRFELE